MGISLNIEALQINSTHTRNAHTRAKMNHIAIIRPTLAILTFAPLFAAAVVVVAKVAPTSLVELGVPVRGALVIVRSTGGPCEKPFVESGVAIVSSRGFVLLANKPDIKFEVNEGRVAVAALTRIVTGQVAI